MPTSRNMAIFVMITTTQPIILPLVHAHGVKYTRGKNNTGYSMNYCEGNKLIELAVWVIRMIE